MPIIFSENSAPTIQNIGHLALPKKVAEHSEIRPMKIGLVNGMPDAAFEATETQFLKLISAEPVLQIDPVLMTPKNLHRGREVSGYINQFYTPIQQAKAGGLDALIFTGGNFPDGKTEDFSAYQEISELMKWGEKNVTSILTSCFSTHIAMKSRHNIERILQKEKIWGVYPHKVQEKNHPLVNDMNTTILIPHSRWNDIPKERFLEYGDRVLLESASAGVGLAVSRDFRYVMLQGHPEYETASLAREYLRDRREGKTHEPIGYITEELRHIDPYKKTKTEELIESSGLENNWNDSAKVLFARWMAIVYRLTNFDIHKQYMDGIGREDPIGDLLKLQK